MTNIEKPAYISREEKNGVTQELVKTLFNYKDGFFYRKIRTGTSTKLGEKAGYFHKTINRFGVSVNGNYYLNSRIVFLWHHGWLPELVDHKDRNTLNDKIENLRAATRIENNRNSTSRKNTTSQYLGVHKRYSKWYALISYGGKTYQIGKFETEKEAALAYNEQAKIHFGDFANLNIIKP